ncbi:nuclear cap-binding protein subunit 3-like [Atheta coriaria]|uniref:nuclear cap-binding protein subunit 3-like n=1 Tax=Dalotia coriaria TaxID=877792 RepID=UPI0031F33B25
MAESDANSARPNIRIEIHNSFAESMDVDLENSATKLSDGEEGEIIEESVDFDDIIDNTITYPSRPSSQHQRKAQSSGPNNFDKDDLNKRLERANRFQMDNKEAVKLTRENFETLHESLGINHDNEDEVCFDTLHLHGTEKMSSHHLLEYFDKFSPLAIEWVDNNACNVLWSDDVSSARALFHMSKPIKGLPVEAGHVPEIGKSILLKNNNGDAEEDDENGEGVSISDINIPIPPGYWRLGAPHQKSTCILIRFALISDRRVLNSERGGGIISESKKAEFRGIFERNRDIPTKNPWGDLARSWNRDKKTEDVAEPVVQPAPQLKHRLGFKRSQETAFEKDKDAEEIKPVEKPKIPRMRMYADEEEAKIKRKKALDAIKRAANPPKTEVEPRTNDLRSMIRGKAGQPREILHNFEANDDVDDIFDHRDPESELPQRSEVDLSCRLTSSRLKFTNPAPLTIQKRNDTTDVRQRLDNKKTKQHRFRDELLKNRRHKSPTPPPRESRNRNYDKRSRHMDVENEQSYSEEDEDMKTNSKVTVVIKKPKQPTVASTVWSRVNTAARGNPSVKDRLQMPAAGSRGRKTRDSRTSSEDDSGDSSGDASSNEDDSMNLGDGDVGNGNAKILDRPGFKNFGRMASDKMGDHKSPLRIEINNDHYKK